MMKSIALIAIVIACTGSVRADETLFSDVHSGVYFAPLIGVGSLKSTIAVTGGGRLAWVANNSFAIGIGGSGLMTPNAVRTIADTTEYAMVGYGGLFLEWTPGAEHLIHPAFAVLVGGGFAGTRRNTPYSYDRFFIDTTARPTWFHEEASPLFVVEPSASLEINLASFLRLDASVAYRYMSNFTQPGYARNDVSGLTGTLGLKLGWF